LENFEFWKVVFTGATVLISLVAVAWGMKKDIRLKTDRLREDFKFTLELKSVVNEGALDALIKERGYHALVGRDDVPSEVIEYLVTLKEPSRAMYLYRKSRKKVVFFSKDGRKRLAYKGLYKKVGIRNSMKVLSWVLYMVLYIAAASPALMYAFKLLSGRQSIELGILTVLLFFPLSIVALRYGVKIKCAESLMALRSKRGAVRI